MTTRNFMTSFLFISLFAIDTFATAKDVVKIEQKSYACEVSDTNFNKLNPLQNTVSITVYTTVTESFPYHLTQPRVELRGQLANRRLDTASTESRTDGGLWAKGHSLSAEFFWDKDQVYLELSMGTTDDGNFQTLVVNTNNIETSYSLECDTDSFY